MSSIKGLRNAAPIWARSKLDSFLEYDTPKMVHINSWKAGATNRLIQLGIISYVVGYVIVWNHGYQDIEMVEGTATAKVKGTSFTNITDAPDLAIPQDMTAPYNRVWDVSDYVIPPQQQTDAFFIMSNMVITPDQTQSHCAEHLEVGECTSDLNCTTKSRKGHGEVTGRCITYDKQTNTKSCEIYSWCPVEIDTLPRENNSVITNAEDFTVLIRNSIAFPMFNFKKINILAEEDFQCSYDPVKARFCPIFRIGTILDITGHSFESVARDGAVVIVDIQWNCNLDQSHDKCLPKYRFARSDIDNKNSSNGFNFRWSYYYKIDGKLHRTLTKAFGILFKIKISGQAGKFSVIPLMLNIGSGLALLSLATVMCDVVVLYVLKKRHLYKEVKYQNVSHGEEECEEIEIQKMSANHKGLESNDILLT